MTVDEIVYQIKAKPRRGNALTIDEIKRTYNLEHEEALKVLKLLRDEGLGRFVVGRGSSGKFKTRIEWLGVSSSVASPAISRPETGKDAGGARGARVCINYNFPLDDALDIALGIPRDLTLAEAERISRFIKSLAKED
jgi:hypothetical protein